MRINPEKNHLSAFQRLLELLGTLIAICGAFRLILLSIALWTSSTEELNVATNTSLALTFLMSAVADGMLIACGMSCRSCAHTPTRYRCSALLLALQCAAILTTFILKFDVAILLNLVPYVVLLRIVFKVADHSNNSNNASNSHTWAFAYHRASRNTFFSNHRTTSSVSLIMILTFICCTSRIIAKTVVQSTLPTQPISTYSAVPQDDTGTITFDMHYVSDVRTPHGTPTMQIAWRDAWFTKPSTTYNHALATVAMQLAIFANSEAQYYNGTDQFSPHLEDVFARLGFTDVDTSSYYRHSDSIDEISHLISGKTDVVGYGLARKAITTPDGSTRTLVVCAIRGTWGTEWLSNLRTDTDEAGDTRGFGVAADAVIERMRSYTKDLDPKKTSIFICGHSRGGSVTNLVARKLNDMAKTHDEIAARDAIYAYGFAVSGTTKNTGIPLRRHANIFNINNPSDIVPRLPLASWGFVRYGVDVTFPDSESAQWDSMIKRVQKIAQTHLACELPYNFPDQDALQTFLHNMSKTLTTPDDAYSLHGFLHVAHEGVQNSLWDYFGAHLPDSYLAWLEATCPDDLVFMHKLPACSGKYVSTTEYGDTHFDRR